MTQEQKELLIKDLCGRLPYGVILQIGYATAKGVGVMEYNDEIMSPALLHDILTTEYSHVKPYLRPMSSMTEEDVQEIRDRLNSISIGRTITKENFEKCCDFLWFTKMSSFECVSEKMMDVVISYLDKNMFDYRGLIPMGIALEAPKDMYKN
jgi:hypothetical protein